MTYSDANHSAPPSGAFAQVEPIAPENAGQILNGRPYRRLCRFNFINPLLTLGCFALLLVAGALHRVSVEQHNPAKGAAAMALFGVAIVLLPILIVVSRQNHWLQRIAYSVIGRRSDKVVDPKSAAAFFVEIVPESNWDDVSLFENASDVGFLEIDPKKKMLFYEGENIRYRIPASAIAACKQDFYTRAQPRRSRLLYLHFVLVTVRVSETASAEIPFRIRKPVAYWSDARQREENYALYRQVIELAGLRDS